MYLDSKETERQLAESTVFITLLMIVGGYLNAYTFITRGGVFANNQTGNLAKLGVELANLNWSGATDCLLPILGCMLGAGAAAYLKSVHFPNQPNNWRRTILILELLTLFIVGFLPTSIPHRVVNISISFITAFQLSGFRTLHGIVCNTTISTGNLRTAGQFWSEAFIKKDKDSFLKALHFGFVVFSFAFGALLGTIISLSVGIKAIWVCCFILLFLIYRIASVLHLPLTQ